MRRNPPIRITKNDRQEYARLVRNTKAKIRRTAENYGVDLSNQIEIPSLESFKTREEFNEFKHKQKSFTSVANRNYQFVKNEYGVVASKKEIDEIKRNTKKAQQIAKKLQKEVEKKPFISGGKEQGTVGQRMKQMAKPENMTGISVPNDFDFGKVRTRKQLEQKKDRMEDRANEKFYDERMERGKESFIKLLELTFNNQADRLVDRLREIPPDDFYELYLMFDEFGFDYFYTDDANAANDFITKLESNIERYYSGNVNMDLKGF